MKILKFNYMLKTGILALASSVVLLTAPSAEVNAQEEDEMIIFDEPSEEDGQPEGEEPPEVIDVQPEFAEPHFIDTEAGKNFVDENGQVVKDDWIIFEGRYFYADANGSIRTKAGWISVEDNWYYVEAGGAVRTDSVIWSGGTVYYVGKDGALTGGVHEVNGKLRLFGKDGKIIKKEGWQKYDGKWYYLTAGGFVTVDKVIEEDGQLYYAGKDGALTECVIAYNGKLYYFNKNGKARKAPGWVQYDGVWYFISSEGTIATNSIVGASNDLYYVGEDGKPAGGIYELNGKKLLFDETGAQYKKSGWKKLGKTWYYISKDSSILENDGVWSGGSLYYLGENGILTGGIHKVSNKLRYFDKNGKLNKKGGWLKDQGNWYYVDDKGIVYSDGKYKIEDKYYYFNEEGIMQTGVIQLTGGVMYYARKSGALAADEDITIKGIKYHADETGKILVGTMHKKAQSYTSDTDYLILVNLSTQKTAVFKGSKDNWLLQKEFTCSTGTKENSTPTGEYKTTIHDLYFDSYGYRCWYATGFIGGLYLFHSSPCYMDSAPNRVADSTMGRPSSHGCIRLTVADAKWMYDNLPLRTKVVIFN